MAFLNKEVNQRLAKRTLKTIGRLANRWLTSLVKEASSGSVKRGGHVLMGWASPMEVPDTHARCVTDLDQGYKKWDKNWLLW